ncbi:efflux RND transporter periplasmic adaptor subunit [Pseudoduganella violacea]|uniref:RND family efflux transporter MFP subunit n=1 Tax=Pseudoduganella violacea TaxID=1715466 RepID=A0A7W5B6Z6_9BURK|nr:efflux RND transporter periplasmic adaptor subunit [Pseudoduganella violacea]MBB3117573.1 RND family efflux transporter MFP subunit [Pseudoduganella violacea]
MGKLSRMIWPALLCVGVGVAAVGAWLGRPGQPIKTAPAAAPAEAVLTLAAAEVATATLRPLPALLPISGSLVARQRATVRAKVNAEVRGSLLAEGVAVRAGQVLLQLDTADLRAQLAMQRALRQEAQARLALAQRQHASSTQLQAQQFISQHAYDTTHSNEELARAALGAADARLEIAQRALDDATVRAPYAGIVSKRFVQAGDKVAPDTPLFAIVDLEHLVLEAAVPASDIARVRAGQQVDFTVDGHAGRRFSGTVARVNPETEAGARAMLVYIEVHNRDRALSAGMFAQGSIALAPDTPSLLVPSAALRRQGNATVVYRIEQGRLLAQTVQTRLDGTSQGWTAITAGLAPGARIVGVRLDGLKTGRRVRLADDGAAAAAVPVPPPAPAASRAPEQG